MKTYDKEFESDALKMWQIRHANNKVSLKIDFNALKRDGIRQWKIDLIKKFVPTDTVNYFYTKKNGVLNIFCEESNKKFDWRLNFMAFSVKIKIGSTYRRYHSGFYSPALTIFNDLKKKGLLNDCIVKVCGYSHGAAVAHILGSYIRKQSRCSLYNDSVISFETPRYIYRPSKNVKREHKNDIWYKQGNDIVTQVPWWMSQLGQKRQVKSPDMPWYKRMFAFIHNHNIYPTDPKRNKP